MTQRPLLLTQNGTKWKSFNITGLLQALKATQEQPNKGKGTQIQYILHLQSTLCLFTFSISKRKCNLVRMLH